MSFNRRPDRRSSGPRSGGYRSDRRDFDRSSGGARGDRPAYREDRGERPERGYAPRGDRPERGFAPRGDRPPFRDEGGMSLRLDPRHLGQLKRFAGDAGLRPGELAMQWIVERLDVEMGRGPATGAAQGAGTSALAERVEELARRVEALEGGAGVAVAQASSDIPAASDGPQAAEAEAAAEIERQVAPPAPRRRRTAEAAPRGERIGLHDEIAAVIRERGPLTASELATAIGERGRYVAPRSTRPLDAATVNSRVSNPAYRGRFTRSDGRIGLTDAG